MSNTTNQTRMRPRPHGPMGHGPMGGGEKAKDFSGTISKLKNFSMCIFIKIFHGHPINLFRNFISKLIADFLGNACHNNSLNKRKDRLSISGSMTLIAILSLPVSLVFVSLIVKHSQKYFKDNLQKLQLQHNQYFRQTP